MSKIFVSPSVITTEIDQSYLPAAVGNIGGAFIGTTDYGPAFVPYKVQTYSDAANVFGDVSPANPMMYGVRGYMKNSSQATIVRVLGPGTRSVNGVAVTPGYTADAVWAITSVTGGVGIVHALLEISGGQSLLVNNLPNDLLDLRISGSSGLAVAVTASFLSSSSNYIKKVLNNDPEQYYSAGYFVKSVYDYAIGLTRNGASTFSASSVPLTNNQIGYNSGSTPWFNSQEFGGSVEWNLFRLHTLGHGDAENGRLKVSISNMTAAPNPQVSAYGKFDVQVRAFGDSDRTPIVLESFPSCDLDPGSINFLPRRVGDRFFQYDNTKNKIVPQGSNGNVSKLIRVEMTTGSYPPEALPWGFRGLPKPVVTISGANAIQDLPVVKDLKDKETQSEAKAYMFWGTEFTLSGSVQSRLQYLPAMAGADRDFSLKWVSGAIENSLTYVYGQTSKKSPGTALGFTTMDPTHAQFTAPVAFGFDGFDPRLVDPLQNETQLLLATQLGTQALRQGIDCISDPDFIDINMLVIPGIWAPTVCNYAIEAAENRADTFCIIELSGNSVATVTSNMNNLGYGSNYCATYYPPVKIVDPVSNQIVTVPSSVPAAAAIAYTDRVSFPWYAPAGLNRGALNTDTTGYTVVETLDRLTQAERDTLYDVRINPIASFPGEGIAIWGQKTMQIKASALDRVNVRRLLIKARKLVASAGKYLLFEPNTPATWTRFKQLVNPMLEDIQIKNGLTAFRVVMDETTNTPDLIDRNIMAGAIYLVPARSTETLKVDFIVGRTGTTFSQ